MILTCDVIRREIETGRVVIEPSFADQARRPQPVRAPRPDGPRHLWLEMSNVSGRTLLIHAGVRLLQIVLQRCEGSAVYQGRFARQDNL